MLDRERGKFWTLERAQGAIKAAFFSRGLEAFGGGGALWLRFGELRIQVSKNEGPIGDRMLSRALRGLVANGHLLKKREGKASLYSLVISRSDRIKSFARAENAAIETAGTLGGWAEPEEGWSVYGVPEVIPRKYRAQIQKACLEHQAGLREILDSIWEDALASISKPARGRVTQRALRDGVKGLETIAGIQAIAAMGMGYGARLWDVVEKTVPGAAKSLRRGLGLEFSPESPMPERLTQTLSAFSGVPSEEIGPTVDRELARLIARASAAQKATKPMWDALTPTERNRADRRWDAATRMSVLLTTVVHA